ncbi:MAG: phosphotransferase enzyme family protein, partial [Candidatus Marinimicrobia bacterium]|nr:phosphotransferase enzyme family protein [Candidatus Neomarinimicrobiota bacterium]
MEKRIKDRCIHLFEKWAGVPAESFTTLPLSGGDRRYFRIRGGQVSAIAAHNTDKKENRAFLTFSKHFHSKGCAVPEIYAVDEENDIYLQQDLGDETLFSYLSHIRENSSD